MDSSNRGIGPNWIRQSELLGVPIVEEPKFIAFSGSGNRLDGKISHNISSQGHVKSEDEMIAEAIQLSLQAPLVEETDAMKKDRVRKERLAALEKRGLK